MSKVRLRSILILIMLAIFSLIIFLVILADRKNSGDIKKDSRSQTSAAQNESVIRLIAVGDMLPHSTVNKNALKDNGTYDYTQFFSEIKPFFSKSDIRFCNHESVAAGEKYNISGYPVFNAPKKFTLDLVGLGCNTISLANNHINDLGQLGIDETVSTLKDNKNVLAYAGANSSSSEQARIRFFSVKNVSFAFLAFSEISNNSALTPYGLNTFDEVLINSQIELARMKADVVLVSAHWGTEYTDSINESQQKWAKIMADKGVDIVLGTGPHVVQPVEILKNSTGHETLVWYSLGNMLSTQEDIESLIGGIAIVEIERKNGSISFHKPKFLPTYMHYEWSPSEKASSNLLARKNLKIYPLDKAADVLKKSLHNTNLPTENKRIDKILNRYTTVKIINSDQY